MTPLPCVDLSLLFFCPMRSFSSPFLPIADLPFFPPFQTPRRFSAFLWCLVEKSPTLPFFFFPGMMKYKDDDLPFFFSFSLFLSPGPSPFLHKRSGSLSFPSQELGKGLLFSFTPLSRPSFYLKRDPLFFFIPLPLLFFFPSGGEGRDFSPFSGSEEWRERYLFFFFPLDSFFESGADVLLPPSLLSH